MLKIFMVTCCIDQNHFWNKLGVNPSPFHISTRLRLTLAVVARGGYVPLVALPSAVLLRRNESGGT